MFAYFIDEIKVAMLAGILTYTNICYQRDQEVSVY